jgi:hypothetical protein
MSCTISPSPRLAAGVKRKGTRMPGQQAPKRACDVCHARKVKVRPKTQDTADEMVHRVDRSSCCSVMVACHAIRAQRRKENARISTPSGRRARYQGAPRPADGCVNPRDCTGWRRARDQSGDGRVPPSRPRHGPQPIQILRPSWMSCPGSHSYPRQAVILDLTKPWLLSFHPALCRLWKPHIVWLPLSMTRSPACSKRFSTVAQILPTPLNRRIRRLR